LISDADTEEALAEFDFLVSVSHEGAGEARSHADTDWGDFFVSLECMAGLHSFVNFLGPRNEGSRPRLKQHCQSGFNKAGLCVQTSSPTKMSQMLKNYYHLK